uniref:Uncharacterized protein n=1 Tax=Anguilla anguilla TaxID=7936 RepID=A0A0E9PL48_ANGAN
MGIAFISSKEQALCMFFLINPWRTVLIRVYCALDGDGEPFLSKSFILRCCCLQPSITLQILK